MNGKIAIRSVLHDLRVPPAPRHLIPGLLVTLLLAMVAWLFLPHFANLDKIPSPTRMGKIILVAFFFPALFEELVFRGFLNPTQGRFSVLFSTVAFVLWHPFAAIFFLPAAKPYVMDPVFLVFVAIFGLFFCFLRRKSGSLWVPILCHWMLTVLWKGLGGAQFLT